MLMEMMILWGAFLWLVAPKQGRPRWVWVTVCVGLFLANVFIGGYVDYRRELNRVSRE
jgi:peptidoglycan/LPS O-acetylase OafA/YrhL